MKKGICIKCQATNVYEVDTSSWDKRGLALGRGGEVGLTHYVCTSCGFMETYVKNQHERDKIAKKKPHITPSS